MNVGILNLFGSTDGESEAETFRRCLDECIEAERAGFDSVWLGEFHFSPLGVSAAPLVIASAVAQRTSSLRIGTSIAMLPLSNPVQLVEAANTVDHLSNGRFHLGIGRGTGTAYEGYGFTYNPRTKENRERFIECAQIVMRCLREPSFSHSGAYYDLDSVQVRPRSAQHPHLPVSASAGSPETYRSMGTLGISLLIGATLPGGGYLGGAPTSEEARQWVDGFREAWLAAGHQGSPQVTVRVPCFVADDPAKKSQGLEPGFRWTQKHARQVLADLGDRRHTGEGVDPAWLSDLESRASRPVAELIEESAVVGSPKEVAEALLEIRDAVEPTGFILEMNFAQKAPLEVVVPAYRLFADKVMPSLRGD